MKWKKNKYRSRIVLIKKDNEFLQKNILVTMITHRIENIGLTFCVSDGIKIHWLAIFAIISFVLTQGLQIIGLFNAKDDIDKVFECFSVMSFCGMGILKLLSLCRNHKQWKMLLDNIKQLENTQCQNETSNVEYESDDENDTFTFPSYIESYTKKFQIVSTVLSRMYGFTAIIYILSPFAEFALLILTGNEDYEKPHVLPGWAPFDSWSFIGYLTNVAVETISATYCVLVHITFDLTSIGVMIFICGQFSLIRDYSSHTGGSGASCNLSKRREDRAHHRIIICHKTHCLLMNTCDELGKQLQNILGVYFSVATLTLCSVAVRLNSELSRMELASLLQFMCATLTQLYLFCHFGHNVLHQSSIGMGDGPFGAAYWCLSPRIRQELVILGMGMMMPRYFKAGPFISVDLPSFVQVLRTAYSYYAVIRK
ncbi:odorant receptor 94b-like [Ostrinia nubilalis]|uniref:odorant receptor 94b-like n=1 Tax=Ostrinia nubilalis TaxID=29057 RepID=UPI0030824BB5